MTFLNDLTCNIRLDNQDVLFKYADDSTCELTVTVWKEAQSDCSTGRSHKCKQLNVYKRGYQELYDPKPPIPSCKETITVILGVIFQCNSKFS